MRVVLDTNVLVSAFVFPGGAPEQVYRHVLAGDAVLIVSLPLLAELRRVLVDKFVWEVDYAEEALGQLLRLGTMVDPKERVDDVPDDPDDNRVLEAAAAGAVDVIVSGDRHLRSLAEWRGIPIRDPASFISDFA